MGTNGLGFTASCDSRNTSQMKHRPFPLLTWTTTVCESWRGGVPLSVAVKVRVYGPGWTPSVGVQLNVPYAAPGPLLDVKSAPRLGQDKHDMLICCGESSTAVTLNLRFEP